MDNHFHLLLEPTDAEGLGKCLHGATFRYAQYFNGKYGRTGRLWGNRYFSCPIDKDAYLWAAVRYIERNPIRAKIARKATSTGRPFGSFAFLEKLERQLVRSLKPKKRGRPLKQKGEVVPNFLIFAIFLNFPSTLGKS